MQLLMQIKKVFSSNTFLYFSIIFSFKLENCCLLVAVFHL